jgi:hypothetical protein
MLNGALEDIDVDKMHFNEDDLNDPDLLAQLTGLEADDGSAKSAGLGTAQYPVLALMCSTNTYMYRQSTH